MREESRNRHAIKQLTQEDGSAKALLAAIHRNCQRIARRVDSVLAARRNARRRHNFRRSEEGFDE
jgi:hypothetical protein